MRLIKPGLYAGTREEAENGTILQETGIRRILTVDSEGLTCSLPSLNITTLHVNCLDEVDADLLSCFDKCAQFIDEGLQNNEAVLVHCLSGVSRSIAILLAYLMKVDDMLLDEAVSTMNQIYPKKISPNPGFMDQLRLYAAMGKQVDMSSALFKQYRLQLLASQIKDGSCTTSNLLSSFIEEARSRSTGSDKVFKCRKCRKVLFDSSSLVEHDTGQGHMPFHGQKNKENTNKPLCTSLFIEPVDWMLPLLLGTVDGKMTCPKCCGRLGSFNWSGMQCSCATWITPGFQVHKNRVDVQCSVTSLLHNINQSENSASNG